MHDDSNNSNNSRRFLAIQRVLLSASSAAAIAAGSLLMSPAKAQDADEADAVRDTIVVTARKRGGIAKRCTAFRPAYSAEALDKDRIDNVEDLVGRKPNLSLSSNLLSPGNDFLNIVVRGVGRAKRGQRRQSAPLSTAHSYHLFRLILDFWMWSASKY